jgi:hypothetical protein
MIIRHLPVSLVFAAVLFAVIPLRVIAAQETQFAVTPVTFEFSANPGETVSNQIKVTNLTSATVQMETRVENISGTGDQGQVYLSQDETTFALSSWVATAPEQFSLSPHESQVVNFTIRVPQQAEPGGHYGTILIGTIASDTRTTGAAISQRIGSLLLVRVSGKTQERAGVKKFYPRNFTGTWDELTTSDGKSKIYVAKGEGTIKETTKKYFQTGPLAFDLTVQNEGNVHIKPTGKVIIYNIFNRPVAELTLDSRNVFPGYDRRMTIIWPHKKLWGIYYRAQLAAVYGSPNQALTATTSFWGFPLPFAIGSGAGLLILLLLRRRIARAFRILIKGA